MATTLILLPPPISPPIPLFCFLCPSQFYLLCRRAGTRRPSRWTVAPTPACVVAGEQDLNPQVRRMLEASGQQLPESKPILEVNIEHPIVVRLSEEADSSRFDALSNIVLDHALLAEGSQLENPAEYVQRMNEFMLQSESEADNG